MSAPLGRRLLAAGAMSLVLTTVTAMSLFASSAVLTVAGVAAATVLLGWFAHAAGDDEVSGLAALNAGWALALVPVGRARWAEFLPLFAAQAAVAVAVGFGVGALAPALGDPLLYAPPGLTAVTLVTAAGAAAGAWAALAVDGGGSESLLTAGPIVAGAGPSVVLVAASNPAVAIGVAAAGLLAWTTALAAAGAALVASLIAAYAVAALDPRP